MAPSKAPEAHSFRKLERLVEAGTRKSAIVESDSRAEWALRGGFVSRLSEVKQTGTDSGDTGSSLSQSFCPPSGRFVY
jgi:hypothetical protein